MEKGFKTIDKQIELLRSRNLHIENKETAKELLKVLLENQQFIEFYNRIIENIKELESNLLSLKIDKVLYKMGFPKNYKNLLKIKLKKK